MDWKNYECPVAAPAKTSPVRRPFYTFPDGDLPVRHWNFPKGKRGGRSTTGKAAADKSKDEEKKALMDGKIKVEEEESSEEKEIKEEEDDAW